MFNEITLNGPVLVEASANTVAIVRTGNSIICNPNNSFF